MDDKDKSAEKKTVGKVCDEGGIMGIKHETS